MSSSNLATEISNSPAALMQYCTHPGAGGVALQHERLVKVGQLQDRGCRESLLQRVKRPCCLVRPLKCSLSQQVSQWLCYCIIVFDEAAIIAGESQEPSHISNRSRLRPVQDSLHLSRIHGDTILGDDMAQVTQCALAESTLGMLDDEVLLLQLGEDKVEVAQVLRP
jgi:hypothetical protein